jgi:hypothetical protein
MANEERRWEGGGGGVNVLGKHRDLRHTTRIVIFGVRNGICLSQKSRLDSGTKSMKVLLFYYIGITRQIGNNGGGILCAYC